jgi:hypothetical protein
VQIWDTKKPGYFGRRRPGEHRPTRPRLQRSAFIQNDHLIGEEGGLFGVVGHEHGGETGVVLKSAKLTSKLMTDRDIEG